MTELPSLSPLHRSLRAASCLVAALAVFSVAAQAFGQAATATLTAGDSAASGIKKKKPSDSFPLSGSVRLNPTIGGGTLVTGAGRRSGADLLIGWTAIYNLAPGLNLIGNQLVTKNLVTHSDSGAVRPYDSSFGDVILTLAYSPRITNAEGKRVPIRLGGFNLGTNLTLSVPTSRASRFQGRITTLAPSIAMNRRGLFGGVMDLTLAFAFSKNFNTYTVPVVEADAGTALARPDGPELLAGGSLVAAGGSLTSHLFRTTVAANFNLPKGFSLGVTYLLFNAFRYQSFDADRYTSPYARTGTGRVDFQWGVLSLSRNLDEAGHFTGTLLTYTASPPFSLDNKTFRFPFWDFRSLADNYTTVGAELSYSF
jgi:hypothetical protein